MATTDILAFAEGVGANVLTQAQYAALNALLADGFTTGILPSNQLNKILRQSTFMASGLANWMVARGISVPDDGNMANLVTEISEALSAFLVANMGITYAGNPNGHVAGTAGVPGASFPTLVWDSTNNILWVCTTTGNAAAALWAEIGESGVWPFYGGVSTGTANAQVVTTPAAVQSFVAGDQFFFEAGFTNTGATTVTVGTFGTFAVRKDSPTGPIPLTGNPSEIVAGNTPSMKFDGTYLHLSATELGTAALANASSNTGTVIAAYGSFTPGHLIISNDAAGTGKDGGPAPSIPSATTSQLYGGSGTAGTANVVTLGTGLTMGAGVLNASPPSGSSVLLNTLTASNSAYLQDTVSLTSAYSYYEIVFENIYFTSAAAGLNLVVTEDGGSTWMSSTYYCIEESAYGSAVSVVSAGPTNCIYISNYATNYYLNGVLRIFNPSYTGNPKVWTWAIARGGESATQAGLLLATGSGAYEGDSGAINGFKISTNQLFVSGNIKIYGRT